MARSAGTARADADTARTTSGSARPRGGTARGGTGLGPADRSDDRREQILLAAAQVIGDRGFGHTRIADVARTAGVSSALVLYYFQTRDRLLTEALRFSEDVFYETMSAHLDALATPTQRLSELITLSCAPRTRPDLPASWMLWLDLWSQAVRHPEAARHRAELDTRWRAVVVAIVHDGQARGDFGAADADRFALALTSLLDGLAVQVILEDPVVTPFAAISIAGDLCRLWLGVDLPT